MDQIFLIQKAKPAPPGARARAGVATDTVLCCAVFYSKTMWLAADTGQTSQERNPF